jgi:hypothetical protein
VPSAADHRNVSGHGQQIGSGELVGIEEIGRLYPAAKEDGELTAAAQHDAALIEAGAFVPLKPSQSKQGDE